MRRSKIVVPLHFVWKTKNRDAWITPDIERQLHRCIASEATQMGAELLAINGTENHIHIAVLFPATISISEFVKNLKGTSSKVATEKLAKRAVYWQEGYGAFAFQIGLASKVVTYIQQQKEHHATETNLWPALEETDEEIEPPSSARTFGA